MSSNQQTSKKQGKAEAPKMFIKFRPGIVFQYLDDLDDEMLKTGVYFKADAKSELLDDNNFHVDLQKAHKCKKMTETRMPGKYYQIAVQGKRGAVALSISSTAHRNGTGNSFVALLIHEELAKNPPSPALFRVAAKSSAMNIESAIKANGRTKLDVETVVINPTRTWIDEETGEFGTEAEAEKHCKAFNDRVARNQNSDSAPGSKISKDLAKGKGRKGGRK